MEIILGQAAVYEVKFFDMFLIQQKQSYRKSISILLVILITAVVLATGLAVATILIVELKTSILAGDSVTAIYAAESGIEWKLYNELKDPDITTPPIFICQASPCPNPDFTATVYLNDPNPGDTTIKSVGRFGRARRALEITY